MKSVAIERIAIVFLVALLLLSVEPTTPRIAAAITGGCLFWWLAGRLRRLAPPPRDSSPKE
jgi:hypothetical protein